MEQNDKAVGNHVGYDNHHGQKSKIESAQRWLILKNEGHLYATFIKWNKMTEL